MGNSQLNRYFTSAAGAPIVVSGHTSTCRACLVFRSSRITVPPTLPEPVPLFHTRLLFTGSTVANPLSPPSIPSHSLREIGPVAPRPPPKEKNCRLLLGPR